MEDAELAALAHAGDREAFGELVRKYAGQARRVARAILSDPAEADDAAQDAFLAALKNLGRFDPGRPFGPWLLRIVANAALDRRRRRKIRATKPLSPQARSAQPGPDQAAVWGEFQDALKAALHDLPERRRIAVVMFDVEGYSHQEIADALDVPVGTVRSDVFHARRRLREALGPWRNTKEEIV
jgi:RNA polymerase sigma-70 factor (ECF subfamily)